MQPRLSVIIPALDAAGTLPATLDALSAWTGGLDLILVDGGSSDGTVRLATGHGARVLRTGRGRGLQLAAGAAAATGDWLLLLHADTVPAPGWDGAVAGFLDDPDNRERAGYFRFALDDASPPARRLERLVAWRCRTLALPYGDQGLLLSRSLYRAVGGVRPLPLMEDVDLVRRLGRPRLVPLAAAAVTSAEKWRRDGWWRRSARNLLCLSLWYAGVPPRLIRRVYG
ncbi:TIGR04283 family arsenosugar biosynthesis glycosyltransferase [Oleisolibacter albus]|uniref:TIGR04283 family arsenosugar biosynthesis glycosyltransferase n=1 Tax=Oleisolibacter albus TaxID=2171757 RepID=UPI0018746AD7|nr:TIGR04283 family arsenosugar biosynthesis glycosyltransferase [Oleisolibacter albus]